MAQCKVGDRIELIHMPNDPCPIEPGTTGTVNWLGPEFQGHEQIGVKWDNGRTLGLVEGIDQYKVIA